MTIPRSNKVSFLLPQIIILLSFLPIVVPLEIPWTRRQFREVAEAPRPSQGCVSIDDIVATIPIYFDVYNYEKMNFIFRQGV